jgi:hypothetical protein
MLARANAVVRIALIAMEFLPLVRRIVIAVDRIRNMTGADRKALLAGMLERLEADVNAMATEEEEQPPAA